MSARLPRCPDCGGALAVDHTAETESAVWCPNPGALPAIEQRRRPAVVVFCSTCEYAVELRQSPSGRRTR